MSVVLDTDVASAILKERVTPSLARHLAGRQMAITFVTVGELTKWTLVRRWGPQRQAGLDRFFNRVVVLPYSPNVGKVWGQLQANARVVTIPLRIPISGLIRGARR